jgi:hypothetical protein
MIWDWIKKPEKGSNHSLSSLGSLAGICLGKILPVHVTSENILPAVPTAHDVINRSRIFHSQLARHAGKTTSSIPIPSRLWFDPFSLNPICRRPSRQSSVAAVEKIPSLGSK